jgi:TetR/AcrR family transcriptional regulator
MRPIRTPIDTDTRRIIVQRAIPLFARAGFNGVSMRQIAEVVGVTPAALYYHFPSKEALYLEAVALAFADKTQGIAAALAQPADPLTRLARFVERFTALMAADPDFRCLLHRELLDGDEARLRLLTEQVFKEQFRAIAALAADLAPQCDAHLLTISMAGLILFHFETAPLRRFLPGGKPEHDDPEVIARHVVTLLTQGMGGRSEASHAGTEREASDPRQSRGLIG